jgi:hypothetical protein
LDADIQELELVAGGEGKLCIQVACGTRGEHTVDVHTSPPGERLARLCCYAVPPEWIGRRPLRADFHIHTTYSDGHSTPAEMLIRGRELGLDVAVITDHNYYEASIEALAERDRLNLNLITMPGEEVSGPNWHILSINARLPIYDLALQTFGGDDDAKRDEWRATTAWEYDSLRWAIEAVQANGGRAYLAHPYWRVDRGFHLPTVLYDRVLSEGILDGLELLGDVEFPNNLRSLARYTDYLAGGHTIPIVGCSDTHRAQHTYGAYWTFVLARDPTPEGILDAIADGWSAACTTVQPVDLGRRASALQAFGSFELVDYVYFMEEQFYPEHDVLCAREAALAYRAWRGEPIPTAVTAGLRREMDALYAHLGQG